MKHIQFEHVQKSYGSTQVVKDLNFTIHEGERLVLLGPSGCGKSTTLRMIAGLESISSGDLYMGEKRINDVPSGLRNVAMVFQNYALYPHMSVRNNIIYGLKVQKLPKEEIQKRLERALEMLELTAYQDRLPKDLSGGQRQRVALARAVVKQSDYFLLDEPLSNLDAQLRVTARKELVNIHQTFKQTMVYVTHDQVEAMAIGDRIALLNEGYLQMLDTPENVYHRPANIFTAKFIGSPPVNLMPVKLGDRALFFGKQTLSLSSRWYHHIKESQSEALVFGIRPEHLTVSLKTTDNHLKGIVKNVENYGSTYGVTVDVSGIEVIALSECKSWSTGEVVCLSPLMDHIHIFNEETTQSIGYPTKKVAAHV